MFAAHFLEFTAIHPEEFPKEVILPDVRSVHLELDAILLNFIMNWKVTKA
jgi:hypothetical protein